MKPLFYIVKKSIKNYIKELKKRPVAFIGYILFILIFIFMIVYSIFAPSAMVKNLSTELYSSAVTLVVIFLLYINIKQGISRGSSFFRLADVNLVFTAPISPTKVLVYGFIKQLYTTFIGMMFMVFQIPNLKNFFPLKIYGPGVIIGTFFFFSFSMSIMGILIYSLSSKSKKRRNSFEKGLNAVIAIFLALFLIQLFKSKDVLYSAEVILNSKYIMYIPFIGWIKGMFMAALVGINSSFYIYLILIILTVLIMIYTLYKSNADYYEDVLNATEFKEQFYMARREGKAVSNTNRGRVRKVSQSYKRGGVSAIFYRHLLEHKKTGYFFIDKGTLVMIVIGVIFGFFFRNKSVGINAVLYFSIYMLLFMTMQSKWAQEVSKPYIFLIPGSSWSKVFYATLVDNIKNLVDGLVLFITVGIMFKETPIIMFLCALSYASFGAIYIYGDILGRRVFGDHSKNLEILLKLLLSVGIVVPGIVISIIIGMKYNNSALGNYLFYITLIIYNAFVSFIILFTNSSIFENLEMK